MSDEMKKKEDSVFAQELNEDELDQVAGGVKKVECDHATSRDIYNGGFPNCAATVESGSECWSNDACIAVDVVYTGIKGCIIADCHKAWE